MNAYMGIFQNNVHVSMKKLYKKMEIQNARTLLGMYGICIKATKTVQENVQ